MMGIVGQRDLLPQVRLETVRPTFTSQKLPEPAEQVLDSPDTGTPVQKTTLSRKRPWAIAAIATLIFCGGYAAGRLAPNDAGYSRAPTGQLASTGPLVANASISSQDKLRSTVFLELLEDDSNQNQANTSANQLATDRKIQVFSLDLDEPLANKNLNDVVSAPEVITNSGNLVANEMVIDELAINEPTPDVPNLKPQTISPPTHPPMVGVGPTANLPAPEEAEVNFYGTAIPWKPTLDDALATSSATGKLVFLIQVSGNFANEEFT